MCEVGKGEQRARRGYTWPVLNTGAAAGGPELATVAV